MSRQIFESVVDDYGRISVRISDEFTVLTSEEAEAVMAKFNHLQAENAKLRELVTAQCECVKHDDCNECVHYFESKCMFPFESMYRELGVEVDG